MSNQTPLITVTPCEGLGNMMFKVAAANGLSLEKGYRLVLGEDNSPYRNTIFKNIPNVDNETLFHTIEEESFNYKPLSVEGLEGLNITLAGRFHSYKYSSNSHNSLRESFTFPVETKYDPTDKISIHVRRNYSDTSKPYHKLTIDYYLNAIDYFKGNQFLVFSDDIEWCKENFKGEEFTFVEGTDDIHDLYLMSLCKHNIIANSTFSWWGAFLNKNHDKIIVCPDKWFNNTESTIRDLFPLNWICLPEESPKMTLNLIDHTFLHLAKPNGRYSSVHEKIASKVNFVRDVEDFDGITLFTDLRINAETIQRVKSKYKIGWLIEPRAVYSLCYDNLENFLNTNFSLMHHHKYSLTELENMISWERQIYVMMLLNHIKEENERIRLDQQTKRRR